MRRSASSKEDVTPQLDFGAQLTLYCRFYVLGPFPNEPRTDNEATNRETWSSRVDVPPRWGAIPLSCRQLIRASTDASCSPSADYNSATDLIAISWTEDGEPTKEVR